MPKLIWDKVGEHFFETGVDHGVLYPMGTDGRYKSGVVWNGLVAVNDAKEGGEAEDVYADNIQYLSIVSPEKYGFSIEAYTYPEEFEKCDGSYQPEGAKGLYVTQQTRQSFGFSYRSLIGNDTEGTDYGYKLYLIYNCRATPADLEHSTVNETVEAQTMTWDVKTTPVPIEGFKPSARLIVDSTKCNLTKLKALEDLLYGDDSGEAKLPTPDEVIALLKGA